MDGAKPDLHDIVTFQAAQSTATAPWPVLISRPAEERRLSWTELLVTYHDDIPPVSVLTWLDIE